MRIFTLSIPSFAVSRLPFSELTPDNQEVEERRKINSSVCLAVVYNLVCSCRRTEAEASMGKTQNSVRLDIAEVELSFRVLIERATRAGGERARLCT